MTACAGLDGCERNREFNRTSLHAHRRYEGRASDDRVNILQRTTMANMNGRTAFRHCLCHVRWVGSRHADDESAQGDGFNLRDKGSNR
jgi:hypothetical protein